MIITIEMAKALARVGQASIGRTTTRQDIVDEIPAFVASIVLLPHQVVDCTGTIPCLIC
jgi:7-keto-8-aminopelargonate synthetase-like enzyme